MSNTIASYLGVDISNGDKAICVIGSWELEIIYTQKEAHNVSIHIKLYYLIIINNNNINPMILLPK
jgi:hypothetical protein